MKKNILLIVVTASLLFACTKDLDVAHNTSLPAESAIGSINDLDFAIPGLFSRLNTEYYYGGEYYPQIEMRGDLVLLPSGSANFLIGYYNYNYNNISLMPTGILRGTNDVLARVNEVIKQMEKLKPENSTEQKKYDLALGRIYALRALAHFDMSKFYSHMPAIAGEAGYKSIDEALSIIISDKVFSITDKPARNTLKEVYDFIEADFNKAIDYFIKAGRNTEETAIDKTGMLGYWSTMALQSRFYLYKGNYQEALTKAREVIDKSPARLLDTAGYISKLGTSFSDESLFEVAVTINSNLGNISIGHRIWSRSQGDGGGGEMSASSKLRNMYESGDVRNAFDVFSGFYFAKFKYPGVAGNRNVNNIKVIRLSEVYLIAMEAKLRVANGGSPLFTNNINDAEVLGWYNKLKGSRIRNYSSVGVTQVTADSILNERAKELYLEGHRPFDLLRFERNLVRYTSASEKNSLNHQDFIDINGAGTGQGIIEFGEWRWFYQYPFRETQINTNLINQSPGTWSKY